MNITKPMCERYLIRDEHLWANIIISEDGFLDIQSDYGDYSYRWGSMGMDIKRFLTRCDNNYLIKKLRKGATHFNAMATRQQLIQDIFKERRERGIASNEAREFYDEVNNMNMANETEYYHDMMDSDIQCKLYADYSCIPCCHEDPPELVMFMEKIWPHFVEQLKTESAAEEK